MSSSRFDIISSVPIIGYFGDSVFHRKAITIIVLCTSLSKLKILENYIKSSGRFDINEVEISVNSRYREGKFVYPYFKRSKGLFTLDMINNNKFVFRPGVIKIKITISLRFGRSNTLFATDISVIKAIVDIINSWCIDESVYFLTSLFSSTAGFEGRRKKIFYYNEKENCISTKDV